jgi:threonine aldolase
MRRAMADAEVGDDDYGEDPTVNRLQDAFAALLGKEAAIFVPSGVMANQIAICCLTRPGDAVVVGRRQHIVVYEAGAGPIHSGITCLTLDDRDGTLDPAEVKNAIDSAQHHQPPVRMIAVEDTHMPSGGRVWPDGALEAIAALAAPHDIPVYIDGARLWHAAVATRQSPAERAAHATAVMCCLSKGLGAPVGSLLAGPADFIEEAWIHRKRLGGGMRQAGVIAAAGLIALARIDRLAEDHAKARRLAGAVSERWPHLGLDPDTVETNIVTFESADTTAFVDHLAESGVRAGTIAPGVIRLVAHADIDDEAIERTCGLIAKAP